MVIMNNQEFFLKKFLININKYVFFLLVLYYCIVLAPTTYKSDPAFRCGISLENESFLERIKCTFMLPIRMLYLVYPLTNQLKDIRKQLDIEPVLMSLRRLSKTSIIFVDAFFGLEVIIYDNKV